MRKPRYVCLHGHFYQPPRESPFTEAIEEQDSAAPFHDWNARILAECYRPNAGARVPAPGRPIERLVDNYRHLSFNFGPTLASWLTAEDPSTWRAIVAADRASIARRGHGNAIAQAYHHAILPLCNARDLKTEIRWGLQDFTARFGRRSQGLWLPECGADLATLDAVAAEGVSFVLLSPYQAAAVRGAEGGWHDVSGARLDPTRPYRIALPSGRTITAFFYDGPIARAIAFEGGLGSGAELARRLEAGFHGGRSHTEFLNVAVDGETFGHHHRGGEAAVAEAFERLRARGIVATNPAAFLARHPAIFEAKLHEPSAWSCAHGVGRWKEDCGCNTGGGAGWNQRWRTPLRGALEKLRDTLALYYERAAAPLLKDPWEARDASVALLLDPSEAHRDAFLRTREAKPGALDHREARLRAHKLLELQRNALRMFTSCGWFFSDVSGLETVQILRYAGRAVQLCRETGGPDLEPPFVKDLALAISNVAEHGDGAKIWAKSVRPQVASLPRLAAERAMARLFVDAPPTEEARLGHHLHARRWRRDEAGATALGAGELVLTNERTGERAEVHVLALAMGGPDVRCLVRAVADPAARVAEDEAFEALARFAPSEVARRVVPGPGAFEVQLKDVFLDERRALARRLTADVFERQEAILLRVFEEGRALLRGLTAIDAPPPEPLRVAAGLSLGHAYRGLATSVLDGEREPAEATEPARKLCAEAAALGVRLEREWARTRLEAIVAQRLAAIAVNSEPAAVRGVLELLAFAEALGLPADLPAAQLALWRGREAIAAGLGVEAIEELGRRLGFAARALIGGPPPEEASEDPAALEPAAPADEEEAVEP